MTRLDVAAEVYRDAMRTLLGLEAESAKLREQVRHIEREMSAVSERERAGAAALVQARARLCEAAAPEEHAQVGVLR